MVRSAGRKEISASNVSGLAGRIVQSTTVSGLLPAGQESVFLHFGAPVNAATARFELYGSFDGTRGSAIPLGVAWETNGSVVRLKPATAFVADANPATGYALVISSLGWQDGSVSLRADAPDEMEVQFDVPALPADLASPQPAFFVANVMSDTRQATKVAVDSNGVRVLDANGDDVAFWDYWTGFQLAWPEVPGAAGYAVYGRNRPGGTAALATGDDAWRRLGATVASGVDAHGNPVVYASGVAQRDSGFWYGGLVSGSPLAFDNGMELAVTTLDVAGFESPIDPAKRLALEDAALPRLTSARMRSDLSGALAERSRPARGRSCTGTAGRPRVATPAEVGVVSADAAARAVTLGAALGVDGDETMQLCNVSAATAGERDRAQRVVLRDATYATLLADVKPPAAGSTWRARLSNHPYDVMVGDLVRLDLDGDARTIADQVEGVVTKLQAVGRSEWWIEFSGPAAGPAFPASLRDAEARMTARSRSTPPALALLLAVAAPACAPSELAPAAAPPDVLPVTAWERRFAAVAPWSERVLLASSLSADSRLLYESGYSWEGYVSMYEATGDARYLDGMLTFVENWIASALPCDQLPGPTDEPQYRGWASNGVEVPLYESYGWRFVTKLLTLMRNEPAHAACFEKVLAFTETHIWDKWYGRGVEANLYRQNTHMASHWAYIGLHLAELTRSATRRAQCLTVANRISHLGLPNYPGSLRTQVIDSPVRPGANFWNHDWGETARPGSDVNHGEAVVTFAIAAHEMGIPEWSRADMEKFVRLLDEVIWPAAGDGNGFVDGTGTGNGWLHGWAKLGRFDVALQRRLESHPPGLDSIWHCGNMAANARILRGGVD